MFVKVQDLGGLIKCQALGWSHTKVSDDSRFTMVDQATFIREYMSEEARRYLLGSRRFNSQEAIAEKAQEWVDLFGIEERIFFSGTTADMAVIVARKCLEKTGVLPSQLDAIIGGTNTGPGYPSLADHIKLGLGDKDSQALCSDVTEACPVGAVAIFNGWNLIRSGACQHVLVVCSEKATELTSYDKWLGSNLFGCGAFAVLLRAGQIESFDFFDAYCTPFDGNIEKVRKVNGGFLQDGPDVHKWVGREVVRYLTSGLQKAGLDPSQIKHLVPHQPSGKTLELLFEKIQKQWPSFSGKMHNQVAHTGNLSGATTGRVISDQIEQGTIVEGDTVYVSTFGAGLTAFNYVMRI